MKKKPGRVEKKKNVKERSQSFQKSASLTPTALPETKLIRRVWTSLSDFLFCPSKLWQSHVQRPSETSVHYSHTVSDRHSARARWRVTNSVRRHMLIISDLICQWKFNRRHSWNQPAQIQRSEKSQGQFLPATSLLEERNVCNVTWVKVMKSNLQHKILNGHLKLRNIGTEFWNFISGKS